MPCHVDPTPVDLRVVQAKTEWHAAILRHHKAVEKAFEDMIAEVAECNKLGISSKKTVTRAKRRMSRARRILSDGFREAFKDVLVKKEIEKKIEEILGGSFNGT